MDIPQVRSATVAEMQTVLMTIVLGFSTDPLARWFCPNAAQYLDASSLFEAFGGRAFEAGSAYISDAFEGAALWLPPGIDPDEEAMIAVLQNSIAAEISDDVMGVFEAMEEYHPTEPVWYLPLIAVDPAFQGKGIGSALMKHALQKCDESGSAAYLESSNPQNMSLYERHGFETVARIQVGSSPVVHPMIRQAQG